MPVESSTPATPEDQQARDITRPTLLVVLEKSIDAGEYRYARQLALNWLAVYPGDLAVNTWLAEALIRDGKTSQGIQILEKVSRIDPEYTQPLKLLAQAYEKINAAGSQQALMHVFMLGERVGSSISMPGWSIVFRNARRELLNGNLATAETYVYQGLALNQDDSLGGIIHMQVIRALGERENLAKFAELYNNRWPDCVVFKLGLAEASLASGDESEAVNLLHQCVAADASGQVCQRWWGEDHPYKPLWPDRLEISLDISIPASVAGEMGWNLLAARSDQPVKVGPRPIEPALEPVQAIKDPEPVVAIPRPAAELPPVPGSVKPAPAERPEWVKKTEKEFSRVAKHVKAPALAKSDGRFPIYVILTTKNGLNQKYGSQTLAVIDGELQSLATAVRSHGGWGSMVFYPDDIETTGKLGLKTIATIDPWKIKLSLNDLDTSLAKQGERIGAVLIVGGPDVVPFHRLPNPTDDSDEEVLSDNPYATLDTNYFIPEWPVGRLPGEQGVDVGLLLQQIRQTTKYHQQSAKGKKSLPGIAFWLTLLQLLFHRSKPSSSPTNGFGYTASVWKRSSLATFRPIGDGAGMLISPPIITKGFDSQKLTGSPMSFFNLHGMAETAEWYGQRDPTEDPSGTDYPVALGIPDLPKNGHAPKFVFSEACYGGYVVDKTEKTSIALRFLSIGSMAVVASSGIAYGAANTPLVGADLLGNLFWSGIQEGYSVGDAFTQAKIGLANEMNKRQGYLDGEDQKTLISFNLFGDPLIYNDGLQVNQKRLLRYAQLPTMKMVNDHQTAVINSPAVSERILKSAKQAVSSYLPGLESAEVRMSAQQIDIEGKAAHTGMFGKRLATKQVADRTVVIFTRKVRVGEHTHTNYARVTMDRDGKLMKMAFSR